MHSYPAIGQHSHVSEGTKFYGQPRGHLAYCALATAPKTYGQVAGNLLRAKFPAVSHKPKTELAREHSVPGIGQHSPPYDV